MQTWQMQTAKARIRAKPAGHFDETPSTFLHDRVHHPDSRVSQCILPRRWQAPWESLCFWPGGLPTQTS